MFWQECLSRKKKKERTVVNTQMDVALLFPAPKQSQIPRGLRSALAVFTTSSKVREAASMKGGRLRPLPPSSPIRWARRGLARRDACVDRCRWPVMRGRRGWIQSLALMAAAPFIYGMMDGGFPNERWPGIMSLRALGRGRGGKKNSSRRNSFPRTGVYTATRPLRVPVCLLTGRQGKGSMSVHSAGHRIIGLR